MPNSSLINNYHDLQYFSQLTSDVMCIVGYSEISIQKCVENTLTILRKKTIKYRHSFIPRMNFCRNTFYQPKKHHTPPAPSSRDPNDRSPKWRSLDFTPKKRSRINPPSLGITFPRGEPDNHLGSIHPPLPAARPLPRTNGCE